MRAGDHVAELYMVCSTVLGLLLTTDSSHVMEVEDSLIITWALAGSVGAAACHVLFFPASSPRESLGVFVGNSLFGIVFGPPIVTNLCPHLGVPINMSNCLGVTGIVAFALSTVVRRIFPILLNSLVKLSETTNWGGMFLSAILRAFNLTTMQKVDPPKNEKPAEPK